MHSTFFPHFTIGTDAYDAVPEICGDYGKTAVIIGGNKSRAAAEPAIRKVCEGHIEILGSFLYGDDATFENAEALTKIPEIQKAEMHLPHPGIELRLRHSGVHHVQPGPLLQGLRVPETQCLPYLH